MPSAKTVWGIDIGQCALKALKLRLVEPELRVEAFDIIEHPKILSQPGADREQMIRNALEQFLARNNVSGSTMVIAASGQSGFTRFVKLPPVEAKQVPEIVRFEAEQQIPFDIAEVIWRWQAFMDPDSPDIEVGIFAMKRTDVGDVLDRFEDVGIAVDVVQMAPLALYNFAIFDEQVDPSGATLVVDVGADKTDLVVADGPRIWTRTLQLGGSNFTAALVKAFKLSFGKAEKLKRTAATSKYARQIFQAMRPVFAELVQEIQRSIGYYTSLHRESRFKRMVGLGNGFRLPGLQKFLEQNLGVPVVRVDSYNKLPTSAVVNAPAFTENVLSFAVAYGLALQGAELTRIETNLLPGEIARRRLWARKRPWFASAAALILVTLASWGVRVHMDASALDPAASDALGRIDQIIRKCEDARREFRGIKDLAEVEEKQIRSYEKMLAFRDFWPKLQFMLSESIRRVATDQPLLNEKGLPELLKIPREQRKVVFVDSIDARWQTDVPRTGQELIRRLQGVSPTGGFGTGAGPTATPGGGGQTGAPAGPAQRGYLLEIKGSTPQQQLAVQLLNNIKEMLIEVARDDPSIDVLCGETLLSDARTGPGGRPYAGAPVPARGPGTQGPVDPLTGEETTEDTEFRIVWSVAVKDEPVPRPKVLPPSAGGAR